MQRFITVTFAASFSLALAAAAQTRSEPVPAAASAPITAAKDTPYAGGALSLDVDATDIARRIFWIRETIPLAKPGPITLLYAEWIPGNHGPRGPLSNFSGLKITANGKPVPWRRDPVNVFAFQVDAPDGARALEVEAQYLTPLQSGQGPVAITPQMMRVNWYQYLLYPAGHFIRRIDVDASIKLPAGWSYATALEGGGSANGAVKFARVSYETLVDSPLIAGAHFRKIELDPGGRSRVTLNVAADEAKQLEADAKIVEIHKALVVQADRLYGARHFNHYDFLLTLSDRLAGSGVEHARSSDNGTAADYFTAWSTAFVSRDLLAHEYTHSWNGKFRRPADLWTETLNTPMRNSLLWVYEGQTQYWGSVLAARAGFLTKQEALEALAMVAARYETQAGREWRPLVDTTDDPIITARRPIPWREWQRSEDYYSEAQLIWLDADTLIRELSGGKRSLNDFARSFFGVRDGDWGQLTYTRADLVAALNKVAPYDWEQFFRTRVDEIAPKAPLAGLQRGGYKLVYSDKPTEYWKTLEKRARSANLQYSIGATVETDGRVSSVLWQGPLFKAGVASDVTIVAVNDKQFTLDRLKDAVAATSQGQPIRLLIKRDDDLRTVELSYTGGARYPRLERIAGTPARLDDILAPL